MSQLFLMKHGEVLVPGTQESKQIVERWRQREAVIATVRRARNPILHRRFFAMLQLAFDAWEPPLLEDGTRPAKNFKRFRREMIVLAGHYELVASMRGDVIREPKSIAYDEMAEDEFAQVCLDVAGVVLERILTNYTHAELERVVLRVLESGP